MVSYPVLNLDDWIQLNGVMLAQSWTVSVSGQSVSSVDIELRRTGSPEGTIGMAIYSGVTEPEEPIAVSTTTYQGDEIDLSGDTYTFNFSADSHQLSNGSVYFIVVLSTAPDSVSDLIELGVDSSSAGFAGGQFLEFNGSVWSATATTDAIFSLIYTPSTYVDPYSLITWSCDANFVDLIEPISTIVASWEQNAFHYLQINSDTEPSLANWETVWITEGNTLPIEEGTVLYWYKQNEGIFGGYYIYIKGGVSRLEHEAWTGKSQFITHDIPAADPYWNDTLSWTNLGTTQEFNLGHPHRLVFIFPGLTHNDGFTLLFSYDIDGVYPFAAVSPPSIIRFFDLHALLESTTAAYTHDEVIDPGTYIVSYGLNSAGSGTAISEVARYFSDTPTYFSPARFEVIYT